jgi:threonylcarbamoyladenosine tRNA methylthiotransferase CDKAL1
MKIYLKGLNSCLMRRQNISQYRDFLRLCGHEVVTSVKNSDVILLWTCAFRADVCNNSLMRIKHYQKRYAGKRLVIAGCLPDIDAKALSSAFKGDVVNWRDDAVKMAEIFGPAPQNLADFSTIYIQPKLCEDSAEFRCKNPGKDATFPDQFIKLVVAQGCNHSCSYCSEHLVFPPYHSFPLEQLVEHCRDMVCDTGQTDIMLLADSVGEYGKDIGSSLPKLIRALREIDPKIRIALNNLNLTDFIAHYDDMREFIRLGFFRHLNLPIQSASARILKLMNREYSLCDMHKVFSLLNEMGFTDFDTHIIVGFPTETDSDFQATLDFVLKYRPRYVLLNRYFEVPTLPAASLPEKVSFDKVTQRICEAEQRFTKTGILYNSDALMKGRLMRVNRSKL